MSESKTTDKSWAYRVDLDAVVFAPYAELDRHLQILHALEAATTWGEFASLMPSDAFEEIMRGYDVAEEARPAPNTAFSRRELEGRHDGIYPPGVSERMEEWMPDDLLRKYGRFTGNPGWGAWWEFDRDRAEALADELRARGYSLSARHGDVDFY